MEIRLGTSGFYYEHWVGKSLFYPPDLDKRKWLNFYSKYFNTVEINSSFYRMPFKNVLKGWYNKTPENFVFAFKGSRLITHVKKLKNIDFLLKKFYSLVSLVKEKLGPILWQFPPSLKRDDKLLASFCKKLDKNIEQAIEFRHKSWYSKEVYEILRKYKIGYCIVSCPNFPTHLEVTSNFAYIRFHGKKSWYSSNYSKKELKDWADKIKNLKTKKVYGYFNNDFNCYAPKNCLELIRILKI